MFSFLKDFFKNNTDVNQGLIKLEMPESKLESPKYEHPKILLLDLTPSDSEGLKNSGYSISTGSLGTPYLVKKSSDLFPLIRNYHLPQDYKEHDIVIIDLEVRTPKKRDELENIELSTDVDYWWVNHEYGLVDPRILNGNLIQNDFNRIFNVGGISVIFAAERFMHEFHWGSKIRSGHFNSSDQSKKISNWSFLRITGYSNYFNVDHDHGSIIKLSDDVNHNSILGQFLSGYLEDANFKCTIGPGYQTKNKWFNLLVNKYGDSVGGALNFNNSDGMVFIFPNIKNKSKFLSEFVHDILPTLKPQLFPEIENTKWLIGLNMSLLRLNI